MLTKLRYSMNMLNRPTKTVAVAVLVISLSLFGCTASDSSKKESNRSENRDSLTILVVAADSISAIDLLSQEHQVESKKSGMGVFITGIDSVTNGDGHFWLYSVNDNMASVAADKYLCNKGDSVRFHFRAIK